VLAYHPSFTPDQVKGALLSSTTRLVGQKGTGFGEVNAAAAVAVSNPPVTNQHLNDFVTADPNGGSMFDPSAWHNTVQTQSNWVASNWVASNWVESNWVASNWVESNWVESNWVESNWVESNWVESNWVE
jgi:hypothetical protein